MALKIKGFVAFAATGILGLGMLVGGPAASAADLDTVEIDCFDGEPAPTDVTGAVGDTFELSELADGSDVPPFSYSCTFSVSPAGVVAWSTNPGGPYGTTPTDLDLGQSLYFTLLAPGTATVSFTYNHRGDSEDEREQSFTITVSGGTSSGGSSGPVMQLQQLPLPASGNCSDADPNNALWAKTNATPWTLQWGEWSEPVPFSGFVCGRWVWGYGAP